MQAIVNTLVNFFNSLITAFQDIILWFQDFFLYIPRWCYAHLVNDVIIPLLTWVFSLLPNFSQSTNFVNSVAYFLSPFQLGTGLTMIIGAYTLRFVIRRLPVVG